MERTDVIKEPAANEGKVKFDDVVAELVIAWKGSAVFPTDKLGIFFCSTIPGVLVRSRWGRSCSLSVCKITGGI